MSSSADDTINLDSSSETVEVIETPKKDFVPVKAGGQLLLDDTVELSDSDEEVQDKGQGQDVTQEDSRYITSIQSPPVITSTPNVNVKLDRSEKDGSAFHSLKGFTPAASGVRTKPIETPSKSDDNKHLVKVFQDAEGPRMSNSVSTALDIKDEFCQSDDEDYKKGSGDTTRIALEKSEQTDSAISSRSTEQPSVVEAAKTQNDSSEKMLEKSLNKPFSKSDLPKTCTILELENGKGIAYLIGTAHFSKESIEDVRKVIQLVQPDCVMLELCPSRTEILKLDEETLMREGTTFTWEKLMAAIERYGKVQGVMYLLMMTMSAQLTKELGMAPGGEFRAAVKEAKNVPNCIVRLGDRPIDITMKRAFASLSLWQKFRLGIHILTSGETITKEEVEKCKEKDILEAMITEMAGEYPELTKVFVEERDLFLSHTLLSTLCNPRPSWVTTPAITVGVVGIGHVSGIQKYWNNVKLEDVKRVTTMPKASRMQEVAKFAIKAFVFSALAYGGYRLITGPINRLMHGKLQFIVHKINY